MSIRMSLNEQISYINKWIFQAIKADKKSVQISLAFPNEKLFDLLSAVGYMYTPLKSSGKKDGIQTFIISWRTEDEIKEARADLKRMVDDYINSNTNRNNNLLKNSSSHAIQR